MATTSDETPRQHNQHDVSIIILAAGASKRFGRAKQLVEWKGKSFVQNALDVSLDVLRSTKVVGRVILVLGCNAEPILASLVRTDAEPGDNVIVLQNTEWQIGMSSSIHCGVQEAATRGSTAVLLWTCDQVLVGREDLQALIHTYTQSPTSIAASHYAGIVGIPAVFSSAYFSDLLNLRGDQGARGLIQDHTNDVVTFDCEHAVIDVDTEEDLFNAMHRF